MAIFGPEAQHALVLSTLAGLSTGIGGVIAIIKRPENKLLAALLGVAIGVMVTLSVAEMYIRNAMDHGWLGISSATAAGMLVYYFLQPYFPNFEPVPPPTTEQNPPSKAAIHSRTLDKEASSEGSKTGLLARSSPSLTEKTPATPSESVVERKERLRAAELLRLGLLMALTMTLHNMPEGFAVAFSSFTDFGPMMALAIAIHNIPEGVIVAAPVYAATSSRYKALGVALASGLSEPLGALIALVVVKPFVSEEPLHYILAFVGGIMIAVCTVELWPEARKCKEDSRLAQGIAVGVLIMAGTLAVGV